MRFAILVLVAIVLAESSLAAQKPPQKPAQKPRVDDPIWRVPPVAAPPAPRAVGSACSGGSPPTVTVPTSQVPTLNLSWCVYDLAGRTAAAFMRLSGTEIPVPGHVCTPQPVVTERSPPAPSVPDNTGGIWTIGPNFALLRNGTNENGGIGSLLVHHTGQTGIYTLSLGGEWWQWTPNPSTWINRGSVEPAPPVLADCSAALPAAAFPILMVAGSYNVAMFLRDGTFTTVDSSPVTLITTPAGGECVYTSGGVTVTKPIGDVSLNFFSVFNPAQAAPRQAHADLIKALNTSGFATKELYEISSNTAIRMLVYTKCIGTPQ